MTRGLPAWLGASLGLFAKTLLCLFPLVLGGCGSSGGTYPPSPEGKMDYGVFCGIEPEKIETLYRYRMVVIDAANFTKEHIGALHEQGVRVYSYLNIGSIENFRPYYDQFKNHTLKDYSGWPEEKWIDVSYQPWQSQVVNALAPALISKGIDGFFLDNSDVYSEEVWKHTAYQGNPQPLYDGLLAICQGLGSHGLPLVINGGDTFVEKALAAGEMNSGVTGVNQECVFTAIKSFVGEGVFAEQKTSDTDYFKTYLAKCKQGGLQVYLTEYRKTRADALAAKIADYCRENGFLYYIAPSKNLDRD